MRALLDVNVLIALLDANHIFHQKVHDWWGKNEGSGWASCPISENGVIRIMTHHSYPRQKRLNVLEVITNLRAFATNTNHEFWPEDISLRDSKIFEPERILSGTLLTDLYLLALAAKNQGALVTLDQNISLSAVRTAKPEHLNIL